MRAESATIPFRLASDLDLVSFKKELQPLCHFMRMLAIDKGLGEVQMEDHDVTQRFLPPEVS